MPDLPSTVLGLECKLFIAAAGAEQGSISGAGNEVKLARSVELSLTSSLADVTVRGSDWRLQRRALKEASINLELLYSPGDSKYKQLFDAYNTGTPLAMFASDGFGSGLLCDVSVTEFSQPQPLEDAVVVNCTLVPTFTTRYPSWVTGSGS